MKAKKEYYEKERSLNSVENSFIAHGYIKKLEEALIEIMEICESDKDFYMVNKLSHIYGRFVKK